MNVFEKLNSLQDAQDNCEDAQDNCEDAQDNCEMELRSQLEDILRDAAKEVFDSVEGLVKFYCESYTPRSNDWKRYPRWSDAYWGNLSYEWCECDKNYRLSDDGGVEQEPDFFDSGIDCLYDEPTFNSAEECPKVEYANSGVVDRCLANRKVGDMVCLCEFVYVTNYKVFFTKRDDGSVDVVHEDCDYGY